MPLDSPDIRISLSNCWWGSFSFSCLLPFSASTLHCRVTITFARMNGGHFRSITQTSADLTGEFIGGLV